MEVNGSGGRLDGENFKGEIRKKKKPQRKRNIAGSVKPGKPPARKYGLSVCPNPFGRADKSFFPVCLLWVTACTIHGQAVTHSFPLPAQKDSEKEKSTENP